MIVRRSTSICVGASKNTPKAECACTASPLRGRCVYARSCKARPARRAERGVDVDREGGKRNSPLPHCAPCRASVAMPVAGVAVDVSVVAAEVAAVADETRNLVALVEALTLNQRRQWRQPRAPRGVASLSPSARQPCLLAVSPSARLSLCPGRHNSAACCPRRSSRSQRALPG
jgi:hypothetical protein